MESFNLAEELSRLTRYLNALSTQANSTRKTNASAATPGTIAEDDQYFIANETNLVQQFKGRASQLKAWLEALAEQLETHPSSLTNETTFNQLRSALKYFAQVDSGARIKIATLIKTGLRLQTDALHEALENRQRETYNEHRQALDRYILLNDWLFSLAEKILHTKSKTTNNSRSGASDAKAGAGTWQQQWVTLRQEYLMILKTLVGLDLNRLWTVRTELHTFINAGTKPCYLLLDDAENVKESAVRKSELRQLIIDVLSICVKKYEHASDAQNAIMQMLTFANEKSMETICSFIAAWNLNLVERYDVTAVLEGISKEISRMQFGPENASVKTYATLLVKLAVALPAEVNKQMALLGKHIDADNTSIRVAMIEVIGHIIGKYLTLQENNNLARLTTDALFEILESRIHDTSTFVRAKALQVCSNLSEVALLKAIPRSHRRVIVRKAVDRLDDKAAMVRKQAIRLLTQMIVNHPYIAEGGELVLEEYQAKLVGVNEKIRELAPEEAATSLQALLNEEKTPKPKETEGKASKKSKKQRKKRAFSETESDEEMAEEEEEEATNEEEEEEVAETAAEAESAPTENAPAEEEDEEEMDAAVLEERRALAKKMEMLENYKAFQLYLTDAIRFIQLIHQAMPSVLQLLRSKSKTDVIESVQFLITAYHAKIEMAKEGVKSMVHLIWSKDGADEESRAINVKEHLMMSYKALYLEGDARDSAAKQHAIIAQNLISLIRDCKLAELISLERLFEVMMAKQQGANARITFIQPGVIHRLWVIFSAGDATTEDRRGAMQLIAMLAKANPSILEDKVDVLLHIGFGQEEGVEAVDLVLAKLVCIALQRLSSTEASFRIPNDHPIFVKLVEALQWPIATMHYFPFAEQAINTIFALAQHPDTIANVLVTDLSRPVFPTSGAPQGEAMEEDGIESYATTQRIGNHNVASIKLSKLLFAVGHCGLKLMVHLETLQKQCKKKGPRSPAGKKTPAAKTPAAKTKKGAVASPHVGAVADDLEAMQVTVEEEEEEAMRDLRERWLLYGEQSTLAFFGPVLTHICSNNRKYNDALLQNVASLALAKCMCMSERYCHDNLQLLFTIMTKAPDSVIRSNLIIALGDITARYASLVSDNINYLYDRLADPDPTVKKNALMVLTHLILNNRVQARGHLSEMAKCIVDTDDRIADLAKLFFTELAAKGDGVYNNLADIISQLSQTSTSEGEDGEEEEEEDARKEDEGEEENHPMNAEEGGQSTALTRSRATTAEPEERGVAPTQVQTQQQKLYQKGITISRALTGKEYRFVMRFLFDFIKKERQYEQLIERMCQRLKEATSRQQASHITFCLSLLPYTSAGSIKRLSENLHHYSALLCHNSIFNALNSIIAKARKGAKGDVKQICDDYEQKLQEVRTQALAEQKVVDQANEALETQKMKAAARDERTRRKNGETEELTQAMQE